MAEINKNSLLYMVLILTLITFISAAGLSYVNGIVQEPIRASQEKETLKAINEVLPDYDNNPFEDKKNVSYNDHDITVYIGRKNGIMTGAAFNILSDSGYGGRLTIMVGIRSSDSSVNGMYVLSHAETPGLGDKMREKEWQDAQFKGKPVSADYTFKVTKDGGQIDALTAATITSRAVCEAFNTAYPIYSEFIKENTDTIQEESTTDIEEAEPAALQEQETAGEVDEQTGTGKEE